MIAPQIPEKPRGPFHLFGEIEAIYRRSKNPGRLFWMSEVNYRIGAALVLLLLPTRVSANMVTIASLVVHAVAACYVALLAPPVGLPQAVLVLGLWQLGMSLDCADGSLARERGETTAFGHLLDRIVDFIVHILAITGLTVFVVGALDLPGIQAALLAAFLLGSNLLQLHGLPLKDTMTRSAPTVRPQAPRWVKVLRHGKHFTDEALQLLVAALLLLAPAVLLVYLMFSAALSALWVLAVVGLLWLVHIGRISDRAAGDDLHPG